MTKLIEKHIIFIEFLTFFQIKTFLDHEGVTKVHLKAGADLEFSREEADFQKIFEFLF